MPIRTCISCGAKRDRKELIRLVLSHNGRVIVDEQKRRPGRGGYVCLQTSCMEKAAESRRLARAFRQKGGVAVHPELMGSLKRVRKLAEGEPTA